MIFFPFELPCLKPPLKKEQMKCLQAAYNYCLRMHLSALILSILRTLTKGTKEQRQNKNRIKYRVSLGQCITLKRIKNVVIENKAGNIALMDFLRQYALTAKQIDSPNIWKQPT